MDYKVLISPRARDDLKNAVRFIARNNPPAALRFGEQLQKQAKSLYYFPYRGRQFAEAKDPTIREIPFKSYRIIYQIHDSQQLVAILRFWHGARSEPEVKDLG